MEYKYLGYTFRATTTLHANTMRPLYEIDGLKSRGQKPFLTTVRECRDYIAEHTRTESAEFSPSDGAPNAGRMIKALRTASGMSRKQFADYFDIPYRTLQSWELGDRDAPEYLIDLIAYKLRSEGRIE